MTGKNCYGEVTDGEVTHGEVTHGEVTYGEVTYGEVTWATGGCRPEPLAMKQRFTWRRRVR